jgi:hypothetical protein
MARKIIVVTRDSPSRVLLSEELARDEAQLQEMMKDNPDLLPIDEFGMAGPLLVVGRETTLPSGAVDLIALARGGEVLLIEFKTGPQNADFRSSLAQLVDYGSDLWQMSIEQFETSVAQRYFGSERCGDPRFRGKTFLDAAVNTLWGDLSAEEKAALNDRLAEQLASGTFHYVIVAQRLTPTTIRTIEYLNTAMVGARFYAVELVRFAGDGTDAFEARTISKPSARVHNSQLLNEERFLEGIADDRYREEIRELLALCQNLGLRLAWGTVGTSIRLVIPDRRDLLTVGWLFPTSGGGWMGLTDLTLGFDPSSARRIPSVDAALREYVTRVESLEGARKEGRGGLQAFHLSPETVIRDKRRIADALTDLVRRVGG